LIDIDLLQPLRYKLLVERKGFAFFVDLEYEHILEFCSDCKIIGHNVDNCYRWKKDEEVRGNKDNIIRQKVPAKKQAYVPISDGRVQHNKHYETSNAEKEIINVEESSSKSPQHLIEAINRDIAPADQVQEATTSKQQNISVSRPILAPVSPRSLLRAQDKQLENELNDDDVDWSTDSQESVVKESQDDDGCMDLVEGACVEGNHNKELEMINTPTPLGPHPGGETSKSDALLTPSRVAKDMAFLKDSWANMVEAEDDTTQIMETTTQDEWFQIHLSKNKKKAQKKLMQSSRDSYATRSRVPPKPFR
jgi:hypothetical protein